jgi:hypothetical protein
MKHFTRPRTWTDPLVRRRQWKGDTRPKTDCSNYRGISLLSTTSKPLSYILLAKLTPYADETIGKHQCGFRCNKLLMVYSAFVKYLRKLGIQWGSASVIYRLQEGLWLSLEEEGVLYDIIEFGISMELVRLAKMCLNETYSRVQVGKHLSDMFPIKNGLK